MARVVLEESIRGTVVEGSSGGRASDVKAA